MSGVKRSLLLVLVSCGSPHPTETLIVALPTATPQTTATHSIVVVAPVPSASQEAAPTDTAPAIVHPPPPFDVPFDRGAAAQMLSRVGATLLTCRQPGGPTGGGHVRVAFAPSGQVTRADVDPHFAGTSVGKCIEKRFEAIQIPAFAGSSVIVGKSFTLPP